MGSIVAAVLLSTSLARGASSFPHSGNPCDDACAMTRMACDKQCADQAKQGGDLTTCKAECDEQVAGCKRQCPAALQQARKAMKAQGQKDPSQAR